MVGPEVLGTPLRSLRDPVGFVPRGSVPYSLTLVFGRVGSLSLEVADWE